MLIRTLVFRLISGGIAVLVIFFLLICTSPVSFAAMNLLPYNSLNEPFEPRLVYPVNDTVVLTGKDHLEFEWLNDFTQTDHFIFKIYKGYNMYASALIYKQDISSDNSSIKIKSDFFTDGQVYTWSLIRVGFGGQKSQKSFISFRVIKK